MAARNVSNQGVGKLRSMVSGSNSTSHWIASGREALGGGLAAGFHLEHGILADTGSQAAARFCDRRSTVSLVHLKFGDLRLGRDLVPRDTGWSRCGPFACVGAARSANLVAATPVGPIRSAFGGEANTTVRSGKALQLPLPAGLAGLEGGLMLAPGDRRRSGSGPCRAVCRLA